MEQMTQWLHSVADSFTNNLIVEDRYRMILDGLQVTLLITFCAVLLGTLLGGLVKILILIGYMIAVAFVPDVRRTFQYHGAEHKSVHCYESDLELTPANAQTFSRRLYAQEL